MEMGAAFEAALDEAPDCPATRMAYADWLRDEGRETEGALQEWLARNGKCPKEGHFHYKPELWDWFSADDELEEKDDRRFAMSLVANDLFEELRGRTGELMMAQYATRREA